MVGVSLYKHSQVITSLSLSHAHTHTRTCTFSRSHSAFARTNIVMGCPTGGSVVANPSTSPCLLSQQMMGHRSVDEREREGEREGERERERERQSERESERERESSKQSMNSAASHCTDFPNSFKTYTMSLLARILGDTAESCLQALRGGRTRHWQGVSNK